MTPILASTSPIRRLMLDAAGICCRAVAPDVDEAAIKAERCSAEAIAGDLSVAKALSVPGGEAWVIGSDSVVSIGSRLFDKPADRAQAVDHLRFFSGKVMELTSGVALVRDGGCDWRHVETARLHVRPLSGAFIESYLDAEWPEVSYCVGVFRLEGRGAQLFSKIEGDHFTILGMPLLALLEALRERGVIPA